MMPLSNSEIAARKRVSAMSATSYDLWVSDETLDSQTVGRVRNVETGTIGYRRVAWHNQRPRFYGHVYDQPHCTTAFALLDQFGGIREHMEQWLRENPWHAHATVLWPGTSKEIAE
jgi:hypothetical protein